MKLPDLLSFFGSNKSISLGVTDALVYISALLLTFYPFRISPEGASWVASPLGVGLIGIVTMYMLLCSKAITGIVFVYVAYCFLQLCLNSAPFESAQSGPYKSAFDAAVTSAAAHPQEMMQSRVPFEHTLEEAVVRALAPIGVGPPMMAAEPVKWSPVSADHKYGAPVSASYLETKE